MAELFIRRPPDAVPLLVATLIGGDYQARELAAQVLGAIGGTRAVPALLSALDHPNDAVTAAVIKSLKSVCRADGAAVAQLLQGLKDQGKYQVYVAVRQALRSLVLENIDLARFVVPALQDRNEWLREEAASLLVDLWLDRRPSLLEPSLPLANKIIADRNRRIARSPAAQAERQREAKRKTCAHDWILHDSLIDPYYVCKECGEIQTPP